MIWFDLIWFGNRFLAQIGKSWHSPPSFCALAFHNGWEDRNVDACVKIANDSSTSDKNLVNFGPLTPEFCGHICARRATRWALLCISSVFDWFVGVDRSMLVPRQTLHNVVLRQTEDHVDRLDQGHRCRTITTLVVELFKHETLDRWDIQIK